MPADAAEAARWYELAATQGDRRRRPTWGHLLHRPWRTPGPCRGAALVRAGSGPGPSLGAEQHGGDAHVRDCRSGRRHARRATCSSRPPRRACRKRTTSSALHHDGVGTPPDADLAIAHYRTAAEQGVPRAQFALGWTYERGEGVEARRCRGDQVVHARGEPGLRPRPSRPRGDVPRRAQHRRRPAIDSAMAATGSGAGTCRRPAQPRPDVPERDRRPGDDAEAAKWMTMAAEQGSVRAQVRLGNMCEHGRGVGVDEVAAMVWYGIAAAQGDLTGRTAHNALANRLDPEQVARAQQASHDWRAAHAGQPPRLAGVSDS